MKKVIYSLSLMFVIMFSAIMLTACGEAKAESISVKDGTIETTILVNEELDLTNLVLNVKYDNGKTKEVAKNDDMQFSTINNKIIGKQELTITYLGLTTKVQINVVRNESDTYTIIGFEKPSFLTLFENNKKEISDNPSTDFDETEEEFMIKTNTYKVGDDNAFKFLPIITVINNEGEDFELNSYVSEVKVEQLSDDNNYVELVDSQLTNMVAVDNVNSTFDFTEQAVGKSFRITVRPEFADADIDSITFEVKVVNGWNAYTVADLSRIDNNAGTASAWAQLKQQNNIGNENINGIVLHNNFKIQKQDIPSAFFYNEGDLDKTEENVNHLRNRKSIYTRDTKENETFSIYGNYFTIDASSVPYAWIENENQTGHSALFSFGGDNDNAPSTNQGIVNVDSLKMLGNAPRTENVEARCGLLGIITNAKEFNFVNTNSRAFVTNIISLNYRDGSLDADVNIDHSKMYDSFSIMLYLWNSKNNTVSNSILKGSGGPLFVSTHVNPEKSQNSNSNIVFENCELSAPVEGTEAWFAYNKATEIAAQLKALSELFSQTSTALHNYGVLDNVKTFVKNNKAEFIAGIMSDDPLVTLTQGYGIKGSVTIKENNNVLGSQNMEDATLAALIGAQPALKAMPFFQSKGILMTVTLDESNLPNGLALVTSEGFKPVSDFMSLSGDEQQLVKTFFSGEYLNIFQGGNALGVMVKFYNA